jgi:hypothetical protein
MNKINLDSVEGLWNKNAIDLPDVLEIAERARLAEARVDGLLEALRLVMSRAEPNHLGSANAVGLKALELRF